MRWFRLAPLTRRRWAHFRQIKRGYWSAIALGVFITVSLVAELWVNHRALIVHYDQQWFFPTYGSIIPGRTFGLNYDYETNYRALAETFEKDNADNNWILMPPVPWGPFENDLRPNEFPPLAPSITTRHLLGTDTIGRDVFARLLYGFRTAIGFSVILLIFEYFIGITVGCLMGFWGGVFDITFQRIIEVWSNIPTLYVIMIVASIVPPGFWTLLLS